MRVVLVHGAWHGSWCWDQVVERLDGLQVVTVDLPSVGSLARFADDVRVVRDALDRGDGPALLCGHSYGGQVVSEAAGHPAVAATVFLCAFALEAGESAAVNAATQDPVAAAAGPVTLNDALHVEGEFLVVDPAMANAAFYADVHPDLAAAAITRLRPQSLGLGDPVTHAGWGDKPSTYVVCTQDEAVHPDVQRFFAGRCTTSEEWACSHSPMLSRPDDVATLLRRIAAHPGGAAG
jgi:pimeloyl-ACP methyl ester carboxylesterase